MFKLLGLRKIMSTLFMPWARFELRSLVWYTSEDGTSVPQPTEDGTKVSQQIIIFSKIKFILS